MRHDAYPRRHTISPVALALFALALASWSAGSARADDSSAALLAQAHAHNDYLHARPLLDALDHGFNSVEADIFLVDGALLVAHTQRELHPERTLQSLYLDPLRARIAANGGRVYRGGPPFSLLIDIKSNAETTYAALAKLLAQYADIVTVVRDGKRAQQAVDVAISGNRPLAALAAEKVRYAGVDGRMGDLDSDAPSDFMPLISDQWGQHFKWRGSGTMPDAERKKLRDAVAKAHSHGRKVRFWATPDRVEMWQELRDAGVDMINVDDLAGLEKFLRQAK